MATPSLNSVPVPASMAGRGKYLFRRQKLRQAADGKDYAGGPQSAEWTFPYLNQTELDWWIAQLSSNVSNTLTAAELWDDAMTEQSFTSGELHRPILPDDCYYSGLYHDVKIVISDLMPLL
jgi:hypothetical protein